MNRRNFIYATLLASTLVVAPACTAERATLERECKQKIGEACNKLATAVEKDGNPDQARIYFRLACDFQNTNGCVNYAERVMAEDPETAKRVLQYSCDRGNTGACAKLAELLTTKK